MDSISVDFERLNTIFEAKAIEFLQFLMDGSILKQNKCTVFVLYIKLVETIIDFKARPT